jgi:hypothetical protein
MNARWFVGLLFPVFVPLIGWSASLQDANGASIEAVFLDCYQEPQLWRYFTEGKDGFEAHLKQYTRLIAS